MGNGTLYEEKFRILSCPASNQLVQILRRSVQKERTAFCASLRYPDALVVGPVTFVSGVGVGDFRGVGSPPSGSVGGAGEARPCGNAAMATILM